MSVRYRIGLDLGVTSVGWAVVELTEHKTPRPRKLLAAGVRIFDAGVEGSVEQGKDSSRGAERRQARLPRRQHWRTQHRKRSLFLWLQKLGLLPQTIEYECDAKGHPVGPLADVRKQELDQLDQQLTQKFIEKNLSEDLDESLVAFQILPYMLRARAVEGKTLKPFELGRALYHLVQRRGFKSNRKADRNEDEQGVVLGGIQKTDDARGERTLAQYVVESFRHRGGRFGFEDTEGNFGEENKQDQGTQILRRYTHRDMYMAEFDAIRKKQAPKHSQLSEEDWERIRRILFYQRPMKSQRHLIGRCSLEPQRRRCNIAIPLFQEFRMRQQVNHLQVKTPPQPARFLSPDEREVVLQALSQQGEMAFSKVRTLLDLPRGTAFSLAGFGDEDEQKLIGDRTNSKLAPVFGDRWERFSPEERERIALEIVHYRNKEALGRRARKVWGLDAAEAEKLMNLTLEDGYGSLSRRAIEKLLPALRDGKPYATARQEAYPESFQAGLERDELPPVQSWNRDLRNPAVIRALTELRKVVNGLIRKYKSKPDTIHIELTRDLRNSRDRRKDLWKRGEDQRKRREKAKQAILKELGLNATAGDIEKWLLAEECNRICPYTGDIIETRTLLGSHPKFDVEHIFPRRYLDDSFTNKTLCNVKFNRDRKKNWLPSECLSGEEYEAALQRVQRFQGPHAEEKLRRFEAREVPEEFTAKHLNDTRYNTRLAAQFLGTLYGGRNDAHGRQRIVTPTGGLTWLLRRAWHLGQVLSGGDDKGSDTKSREDHRHHAIDAIVVALSTQEEIQRIASTAEAHSRPGERFNAFLNEVELPWKRFGEEAAGAIGSLFVSHRASRSLAGPLHAESNYSKPYVMVNGKKEIKQFRLRKSLDKLSETDIQGEKIVDPQVRKAVQDKYAELCAQTVNKSDKTPAKFWGNREDIEQFPRLRKKDGTGTGSPIFAVRLLTDTKARSIGTGPSERQIASGKNSNYASMVYAICDSKGQVKSWTHEIVTRLDAHLGLSQNQKRKEERVLIPRKTADVQSAWKLKPGESIRFLFPLRRNDMLLLQGPAGEDVLYRVQSLSESEIQLCEHQRTNISGTDRTTWNRIQNIDAIRKRNARIIEISAIGELINPENQRVSC